ncbi:BTB/POZ and MATH domain-containing protein 2-like [Triticum dicoccoides]|uniref:BTB/POZ and MATH domain-containing protein 2-like n=1 Tax=Triticum dicoccoides TaxID=85692 RepID=UPI00188E90EE|nr:BTB/POZ and MATH domain-containing protein 2-like [Triticum dicoccoides]
MRADVFWNLLHFIYTDSLPPECKEGDQEEAEMAQHLMVVADRYGMERLKLICEDWLCRCMNMGTVVTTLVLADQHRCHWLKKACFELLKFPSMLHDVVATDEFEHLAKSHPCVLKELML